jgi:hypothetical protein
MDSNFFSKMAFITIPSCDDAQLEGVFCGTCSVELILKPVNQVLSKI